MPFLPSTDLESWVVLRNVDLLVTGCCGQTASLELLTFDHFLNFCNAGFCEELRVGAEVPARDMSILSLKLDLLLRGGGQGRV